MSEGNWLSLEKFRWYSFSCNQGNTWAEHTNHELSESLRHYSNENKTWSEWWHVERLYSWHWISLVSGASVTKVLAKQTHPRCSRCLSLSGRDVPPLPLGTRCPAPRCCPRSAGCWKRQQTSSWSVSAAWPHSYCCRWSPADLHPQRSRTCGKQKRLEVLVIQTPVSVLKHGLHLFHQFNNTINMGLYYSTAKTDNISKTINMHIFESVSLWLNHWLTHHINVWE